MYLYIHIHSLAFCEREDTIYTEKEIQRSSIVFSICLFVYYFLFLFGFNGDRDQSQFKFAEDGTSLCLDLPLLVVVSWETDAVETSSTDSEGVNQL